MSNDISLENGSLVEPKNERDSILRLLWTYKFLIFNVIVAAYWSNKLELNGSEMLPWYISVATTYICGRIADKSSTVLTLKSMSDANKLGIDHGIRETNPHLSDQPTIKELFGKKKTLIDLGGLVSGIIFPPFGFIWGTGSFIAAIHNNKLRRELNKKINNHLKNN